MDWHAIVSDACQINDLDHPCGGHRIEDLVSDACQINDLDHPSSVFTTSSSVSDACQINDLDHFDYVVYFQSIGFRCLSDQ